jgi:flagellar P-ring protein precursor FlgI
MSPVTTNRTVLTTIAALALGAGIVAARQNPTPAPQGMGAATRVKDVAVLQEAPPLQLIGYGLVIGLAKTGDKSQTIFSQQSLANLLQKFGVVVPSDQMKVENVAAVLVTAELPPFTPSGGRLDVTASSIGDARSLQGGTLLATPLRGPDGGIYATAQGPLSIGGFGGGRGATSITVNHLTVGRVPEGALVLRPHAEGLAAASSLRLTLREPDFVTASRLSRSINNELGESAARPIDAATVEVKVPEAMRSEIPTFMARLGPLPLDVDIPARIVINERTGTVVVGASVRLGIAAVAHGNLSVKVSSKLNVSQPGPMSRGQTTVTPEEQVDVSQDKSQLVTLEEGVTLDAVVRALNALGASPRDIIAIMQALKAAGALRAEIVII